MTPEIKKSEEQNVSSVLLVLLIVLVVLGILTKITNSFVSRRLAPPALIEVPSYLGEVLPDIKNIETIIEHPKLDELYYDPEIFKPVKPEIKGRANPFVPFIPLAR